MTGLECIGPACLWFLHDERCEVGCALSLRGCIRIPLSIPVCPYYHSSHNSEVSDKVPQSRHKQNGTQIPFGHPTRHVVSQLPLVMQPMLGSLAGSCSDLSGPPTPLWPAATSCSFLDIFSKFQELIAKNKTSNVTTSPQSSPHSQQSISCWIFLSLGT